MIVVIEEKNRRGIIDKDVFANVKFAYYDVDDDVYKVYSSGNIFNYNKKNIVKITTFTNVGALISEVSIKNLVAK